MIVAPKAHSTRPLSDPLPERSHDCLLKLKNILVATDFSSASQMGTLCATSVARRHQAKLYIAHIVSSSSEKAVMEGWRIGQAETISQLLADRLDGIEYELVVDQGEVWPALSQMIADKSVGLVVLGTRGRTGVRKFMLGSVAETIFRQSICPVITVGPGVVTGQTQGPQRILAATGFSPHSQKGIGFAIKLAKDLNATLALVNVVTAPEHSSSSKREAVKRQRLQQLHTLIPADIQEELKPELIVEFGVVPERIVAAANEWAATTIILGLHDVEEASRRDTTWAKAYQIICEARCPVLTLRGTD